MTWPAACRFGSYMAAYARATASSSSRASSSRFRLSASSGRASTEVIVSKKTTKPAACDPLVVHRFNPPQLLACYLWPPGVLGMAPVDPFEQVAKLPRRDHHHAIVRRRPDEASLLQPLGVERSAQP